MSPRHIYVEGLIISILFVASCCHSQALTDLDDNELHHDFMKRQYDNLIPPEAVILQENDLLNEAEVRPGHDNPVRFPKLNIKQRKFAVNPGYMSYYNPDFEVIEDERDLLEAAIKRERQEAEDIVKDDDYLEKVLVPNLKSSSPTDEETDESVVTNNEYALEPADAKKASSFNSQPGNVRLEALEEEIRVNDIYFTSIVAVSSAVAVFAIVGAGVCYHRLQKNAKATEDVEYPAYGVTGPGKEISPTSGGDRKLAQNAQMYHYQHQKQQMIAFDSHQNNANRGGALVSDDESDDGEEGDYTVYECPGLATTGEMEVRNPLFSEDQQTPKASSMPPTQSSR
jgi:hypothetical protein